MMPLLAVKPTGPDGSLTQACIQSGRPGGTPGGQLALSSMSPFPSTGKAPRSTSGFGTKTPPLKGAVMAEREKFSVAPEA